MNLKYKIYYRIDPSVRHRLARTEFTVDAINPVRALDLFHGQMQLLDQKHYLSREVLRPKLTPSQYTVERMVQVYMDTPVRLGGTGELIEALVDLPASPNPELLLKPDYPKYKALEMKLE